MASAKLLPDAGLPRVAVAADHKLVAEAVRAAMLHRGYPAVVLHWPSVDGPPGPPPDVAMLLNDLDKIKQVRRVQALISTVDAPWLVLAGVPRGPAWGALYEMGVSLIVSTDISLDDLCGYVDDLHAGRTPLEAGRRRDLIGSWRAFAGHRDELAARVATLTAREEEVLRQLYQGHGVREIAEQGEVTEATVRSQVKAILRKLEVNSQIAAVAVYQEVQSNFEGRYTVSVGSEPGASG